MILFLWHILQGTYSIVLWMGYIVYQPCWLLMMTILSLLMIKWNGRLTQNGMKWNEMKKNETLKWQKAASFLLFTSSSGTHCFCCFLLFCFVSNLFFFFFSYLRFYSCSITMKWLYRLLLDDFCCCLWNKEIVNFLKLNFRYKFLLICVIHPNGTTTKAFYINDATEKR